jgi:tight adherence protein B
MSAGGVLLALAGVLALTLYGLAQWLSGRAQYRAAVTRSRLTHGERAERRWQGAVEDRIRATRPGRELQTRLDAADVEWGLADLLAVQCGGALAGVLLGRVLGAPTAGVLLAVAVVVVPLLHLERLRRQRHERFITQLPDLARAMAGASAAGLSLRNVVDLAASDLKEPAASELTRVSDELRLGQSMEGALANLRARMPSRELAVLITTLVVQHRAGGELTGALGDMALTLDLRKDLRREIRTLLSGTIATSRAVAAMGVASIVAVVVGSPHAFSTLAGSWIGRLVLTVCALLYALGFVLITRITRAEP